MMDDPLMVLPWYVVIGIVWWFIARGFIDAVTFQHTGRHANGIQMALVIVLWPVSFVAVVVAFAGGLFINRKKLKHSILGYWPLIAHASNLTDHWANLVKELNDALAHLKLAGLDTKAKMAMENFDLHMAELKNCLTHQYGMTFDEPNVVFTNTVVQPDPGCPTCGGMGMIFIDKQTGRMCDCVADKLKLQGVKDITEGEERHE